MGIDSIKFSLSLSERRDMSDKNFRSEDNTPDIFYIGSLEELIKNGPRVQRLNAALINSFNGTAFFTLASDNYSPDVGVEKDMVIFFNEYDLGNEGIVDKRLIKIIEVSFSKEWHFSITFKFDNKSNWKDKIYYCDVRSLTSELKQWIAEIKALGYTLEVIGSDNT